MVNLGAMLMLILEVASVSMVKLLAKLLAVIVVA